MALASIAHPAGATPPLADARAYVLTIYRHVPDDHFDYRSVRYAPALASLLRRDDACANHAGGICVIEAVPFCECQDTNEDYAVMDSKVILRGVDRATVAVELRNGALERFTVDLQAVGGAWKVADIHGPRTPSFRAYLARALPKEESQLRAHNQSRSP